MSMQEVTSAAFRPWLDPTQAATTFASRHGRASPAHCLEWWQFDRSEILITVTDDAEPTGQPSVSVTQADATLSPSTDMQWTALADLGLGSGTGEYTGYYGGTRAVVRDDAIAALGQAVADGDAHRFATLVGEINWEGQDPGSIVTVVRWALELGAHNAARRIAAVGHSHFPDHTELAKLQRVTAPPRALSQVAYPDTSGQLNRNWLRDRGAAYRGLWVALDAGDLVASADTVSELKSKLGDLKGHLVTKVR